MGKRKEGFSPFAFSLLSSYPQETPNTQGTKRLKANQTHQSSEDFVHKLIDKL